MSEISLKIEKILGQTGDKSACGVFTNRISLSDGIVATLVSCILVKDDKGDDLQIFVKDIFEISTKKIEGAQAGILDALKLSHDACREYVQMRDLDVAFVNALFYKNACYITRYKDGVRVWVYEPEKSEEIGFEYGSGPLKSGQIYLVATKKFVDTFDVGGILQSGQVDLGEVVDGLATDISAVSDQAEIGAVLIMVKGEAEETEVVGTADDTKEQVLQDQKEEKISGDNMDGPESDELGKGAGLSWLAEKVGFLAVRILGGIKRFNIKAIFRARRNLLYLGLVILIILGLSAFLKIRADRAREKLAAFNTHIANASSSYMEAAAIIDLNKAKARDILAKADREIKAALTLIADDDKAKKLASDISGKLKETESNTGVSFSEVASVDSSLVSLAPFGKGQLLGIGSGEIFKVDVKSKSVDKVNGVAGAKVGYVFDSGVFILSGGNVFKVDIGSGKQEKVIEGHDGSDLAVFLGNVYIVSASGIYKFVPIEKGYAPGVNYLEGETFDSQSHLAIDGSVWVTKNNQILKYLRGKKQDFNISGVTAALGQLGKIYTDANSDNLYVVDVANSALLVVGKDGVYKRAYQASEFGKASGLVVNEVSGKMYITVDKKILEAGL